MAGFCHFHTSTAPESGKVILRQPLKVELTGTRGTFAQFGDSISVTLAFWAPLAWEARQLDPRAARAHPLVKRYIKPECWIKWKGPQFGNEGSMNLTLLAYAEVIAKVLEPATSTH